jgi:hypothetical protein
LECVKVDQMSTCAIHEKTEKLLENLGNLLSFATLPYLTEKILKIWKQNNTSQISYKQTQTSSTTKNISRDVDIVNNWVAFMFIFIIMCRNNLPPVGLNLWLVVVFRFLYLYHRLTHLGGFFMHKNRSV